MRSARLRMTSVWSGSWPVPPGSTFCTRMPSNASSAWRNCGPRFARSGGGCRHQPARCLGWVRNQDVFGADFWIFLVLLDDDVDVFPDFDVFSWFWWCWRSHQCWVWWNAAPWWSYSRWWRVVRRVGHYPALTARSGHNALGRRYGCVGLEVWCWLLLCWWKPRIQNVEFFPCACSFLSWIGKRQHS